MTEIAPRLSASLESSTRIRPFALRSARRFGSCVRWSILRLGPGLSEFVGLGLEHYLGVLQLLLQGMVFREHLQLSFGEFRMERDGRTFRRSI